MGGRMKSRKWIMVGSIILIAGVANAAVIEWKKATSDGDWGTAANWYQNAVPGPDDYVLIWGKSVITYMPEIDYNAGLVTYLGLNWNVDTNQTATLTLTGSSAFLKATAVTYINRSSTSSTAADGLSARIDVLNGAVFRSNVLRMGSGSDNSIEINVGANSDFQVWNTFASTLDILDWGSGDHQMNLLGAGATFSMTGPGDQSALIQSWIDVGYITRDTETTGGFEFLFEPDRNLTTLTAIDPPAEPPTFLSVSSLSDNVLEITVDLPGPSSLYSLLSATNLTDGVWVNVPHSDDGINPFITTNLSYSTVVGSTTNTIYVQADDATRFFGISSD